MSVPVTLKAKQVIATQNSGSSVGLLLANSAFQYGIIIAEDSDIYAVGNLILFDPTNATIFDLSGVTYFLITEDDIKLIETPTP